MKNETCLFGGFLFSHENNSLKAAFASAGNPRCATKEPAALPPRLVAMEGTMKSQRRTNQWTSLATQRIRERGYPIMRLFGVRPRCEAKV